MGLKMYGIALPASKLPSDSFAFWFIQQWTWPSSPDTIVASLFLFLSFGKLRCW